MTTLTSQLETSDLWRILDVARILSRPIALDEMLALVIDTAREVLHADRGTVFLYDRPSDTLAVRVATGLGQIRISAKTGIAGQCAQTRQLINVPDCYADPRFNREVDQQTGYRTRCLLAVPLIGLDEELVGVMQVLNKPGCFNDQDERVATALGAQCAVALQRARLMEDRLQRQKLERDLELARDIQRRVLPATMPTVTGYDLAGWGRPAEETGGDIFDAVRLPDGRVLLLMADATGHGIGPALSVTQVRAMVRMAARLGSSLDDTFTHLNDQLAEDLADNRFVTAFVGILDPTRHTIEYHAAGQGPLLVISSDGQCTELPASTFPMGVAPGAPDSRPQPVTLLPGDLLAVISDGIFEAMDPRRNQFGSERVSRVMCSQARLPMSSLAEHLVSQVDQFVGDQPQADDMTIVLVKRLGGVSGSA